MTALRALVSASAAALTWSAASAAVTVLDFEGIAPYPNNNDVLIGQYYNGGAASSGHVGPSLGVEFTADARVVCLNSTTVLCSNASRGGTGDPSSAEGGMYWESGTPFMNVAAGFRNGFSLMYSTPFNPLRIAIFSELDGGGVLLASQTLALTENGSFGPCADYGQAAYCRFTAFGLNFAGLAKSVKFIGSPDRAAIDDVTFGMRVPGVPEPGTWTLMLAGLALAAGVAHRRQAR